MEDFWPSFCSRHPSLLITKVTSRDTCTASPPVSLPGRLMSERLVIYRVTSWWSGMVMQAAGRRRSEDTLWQKNTPASPTDVQPRSGNENERWQRARNMIGRLFSCLCVCGEVARWMMFTSSVTKQELLQRHTWWTLYHTWCTSECHCTRHFESDQSMKESIQFYLFCTFLSQLISSSIKSIC